MSRPSYRGSTRGLALVEIVVVLVLLGLLLALVAPTIGTGRPKETSPLTALVRAARATAIRRGEVMELEVESSSGAWRLSGRGGADRGVVA